MANIRINIVEQDDMNCIMTIQRIDLGTGAVRGEDTYYIPKHPLDDTLRACQESSPFAFDEEGVEINITTSTTKLFNVETGKLYADED